MVHSRDLRPILPTTRTILARDRLGVDPARFWRAVAEADYG